MIRLRIVSLGLLAAGLLAGPGGADPKPEPAKGPFQVRQYTFEQLFATRSYVGLPHPAEPRGNYPDSFSPDGRKILVSSDRTGVFNAFAIPIDGGEPVQLTDSKTNAIQIIGYFPRDERFLYTSDQGGDEQDHIYVRSPDGQVRDLTPGEKLKAEFLGWAPDGRSFFFATNERDPNVFDVFEMALDGYERKLLFTNEGNWVPEGVSPDRRRVALTKVRGKATDLYLLDRRTGKPTLVTPVDSKNGPVTNEFMTFSPDGAGLYYTTDQGSEFAPLMRYEVATGKRKVVLSPGWDLVTASFSRTGHHFLVAINNDSRTEVRVFETAGMRLGRQVPLPKVPGAIVTDVEISPDGRSMAYYAESGSTPPTLFVRDLKTGKDRQLTRSLGPDIDPADLVAGEVVRFKSFDGTEIPGILYRPHQASPQSPVPAIVKVHGGPALQANVGYSGSLQYLINHGYAVFDINIRGSTGYGKTFSAMDDRKHAEGNLDDCVASKKMLAATGWIDPGRIGIYGASYGGFMVLAALTFRPKEFAAGVDLYGVSNWDRVLKDMPAYWGPERDLEYQEIGDPEKDADALRRISPLFHAEQIERPLLVLQGANDPRVLKEESDSIVEAVKKKGGTVEYLVFEGEGHGFHHKESQKRAYEAMLAFLDKYLKGAPPAGTKPQAD
ncbi:MAG TPA: S9 family peptidase [Thermoanaerobaculia bacterium]|jgi:Tol biopolymer transport system component/dienelactone hydrolase